MSDKKIIYLDDAIDAINALHEEPNAWLDSAVDAVMALSSAQPEQRWIPCSERLPEEDGLYLVTTNKGQTQAHVFNHNGNSQEYWMRCNKAWMPLPEPYQAER